MIKKLTYFLMGMQESFPLLMQILENGDTKLFSFQYRSSTLCDSIT